MFFCLAISEIPKTLVLIDGPCPFQSLLDLGIQEKHYRRNNCSRSVLVHPIWISWVLMVVSLQDTDEKRCRLWGSIHCHTTSPRGEEAEGYHWQKWLFAHVNDWPYQSRYFYWQMNEWIRKWTSSGFIEFSPDFLLPSFISHFLPIRLLWQGWSERLPLIKEHSHL